MGSPEPESVAGRRAYDPSVSPEVKLFVEDVARDNRHGMRGEMAEAMLRIEIAHAKATAQASLEHAEVRKDLGVVIVEQAALAAKVETVLPLIQAVGELQRHDAHDEGRLQGVADLRKMFWTASSGIVAALALAVTVLIAVLK
jgi:hypothetical protein